jgi:hypothetical protein
MAHHEGQGRTLIALTVCYQRLARVLSAVAIDAMVDGDAVEIFDAGDPGQSIDQAGSDKSSGRHTRRAVSADESETATISGQAFHLGVP